MHVSDLCTFAILRIPFGQQMVLPSHEAIVMPLEHRLSDFWIVAKSEHREPDHEKEILLKQKKIWKITNTHYASCDDDGYRKNQTEQCNLTPCRNAGH